MRFTAVVALITLFSGTALADPITERARATLTDVVIECYRGSDARPNTVDRRIRCEEAKERWRLMPAADRTAEMERWIADLSRAQEEIARAYADAVKGDKKADWSGAEHWDATIDGIAEALRR